MTQEWPAGNETPMSLNVAYLFRGVEGGITMLEEETYIFNALSPSGKYGSPLKMDEPHETAFVSRWPENKFPLKVFIGADYGYLFTPNELKQITQIVQNALLRFHSIHPACFRFTLVNEREDADVVLKCRRSAWPGSQHCTPEMGQAKQLQRAEITLCIPKNAPHPKILLEVVHNLLHALGVYGHSNNATDSGTKDWSPEQQVLTSRDIKTLLLLYRCPLALTKKDLQLLWQVYQQNYLSQSSNPVLEEIINVRDSHEAAVIGNGMPFEKVNGLSRREIILQESFSQYIQRLGST